MTNRTRDTASGKIQWVCWISSFLVILDGYWLERTCDIRYVLLVQKQKQFDYDNQTKRGYKE